ncbi:pF13338 domain protein [Clostridium sp. CAG:798]|jgi:predicted transcriptional regulator of viral defense system|nr:pF13338 domain protein [Clostridium sp. CAG:798]
MINKILKIMKKNNEIITPAQLEAKGISRVYLSRMEEEGIIERIDRGIYATKDFKYDEYYLFQLKYPKAIFSYNTALYFYEMTERTPIKMDVTVYREYNPHRFKDLVNVYKVSKELYNLGVTERKSPQGMKVKTYNLERTVCDIIKDNDSLDIETRNKAIKKCIKSKEFSASTMFEYAKKMNIYDKVKNYMEAII